METKLIIDKKNFKEELERRIAIGKKGPEKPFENSNIEIIKKDYKLWDDYNAEYLKQVFNSEKNEYREDYLKCVGATMGFHDSDYLQMVRTAQSKYFKKVTELEKILSIIDLLKIEEGKKSVENIHSSKSPDKKRVFIVHGHDTKVKIEVARFIENFDLDAIILHEQINAGKTVIEKIEEYTNVGFGIVLYTPCDIGAKKEEDNNLQPRARQNVVFEHGYLIAKLGRENVCALVKDNVETPSDISGVVYIALDTHGGWKLKVAKELKNSGYDIDLNKIN